jgi:nucleoside-diphosphate-sugar epimerase
VVPGNALDAATFARGVAPASTYVHLTGVAHPAPWKERQFRAIDLASLRASVSAAVSASIRHFIYVSVAHPAPLMGAYIQVRSECEEILQSQAKQFVSTILRPWYVLGPGHWWPVALKPIYALLQSRPSTRESARRLGLVTLAQMVTALTWAVENPHPAATRILEVPEILTSPSKLPLPLTCYSRPYQSS